MSQKLGRASPCREGGRERDRLQWEWRGVKSQGERQA